jgi:hypothetical protein
LRHSSTNAPRSFGVTSAPSRLNAAALIAACGLVPAAALAQWSTDPAVNTPVGTGSFEQALCKAAAAPDGSVYISWFQNEGGNYSVRLQRFNPDGTIAAGAWGPNGILVSDRPSSTSLVDYDLTTDSDSGAVVVFTDFRDGADRDVFAHRVNAAGAKQWGNDDVQISANTLFDTDPRVVQLAGQGTGAGDFAVVWATVEAPGRGVFYQRLSGTGVPQLAANGVRIAGDGTEGPAFHEIAKSITPSGEPALIVSWLRDTRTFSSPRHVRTQKITAAGTALWNNGAPVILSDAIAVPIAHRPRVIADADGGAAYCWHDTRNANRFNAWIQRLSPAGTPAYAQNGFSVTLNTTSIHLEPAICFANRAPGDDAAPDVLIAWNERNSGQSQWGVRTQRVTLAGTRVWGDFGVELLPLNTVNKLFQRIAPMPYVNNQPAGGAMVFCLDQPLPTPGNRVLGFGVDGTGATLWNNPPLLVSTSPGSKGRLPITQTPDGGVVLAWEDNRAGNTDIYAQRLNPTGTLGPPPCPADFNGDSTVDFFDYLDFVQVFSVESPSADFNGDNTVDFFDYLDFVAAFDAGCQ